MPCPRPPHPHAASALPTPTLRPPSPPPRCVRCLLLRVVRAAAHDTARSETLPADTAGGKPLCMHMYKYLFNTCRVPSIPECTTAMADPATNNHILVIRKNKFYTVDVGPPSARLSPGELQVRPVCISRLSVCISPCVGVQFLVRLHAFPHAHFPMRRYVCPHAVCAGAKRDSCTPLRDDRVRLTRCLSQAQLELVIALAGREKSTPIGVLTAEHRDMWSCVSCARARRRRWHDPLPCRCTRACSPRTQTTRSP